MLQAFEEEMRSLRRVIRHWLSRMGWPRDAQTEASEKLARDLRLPSDMVSSILDRTAADLRKLSREDAGNLDARPIIDRAVNDLSKLGFHSRPVEESIMDRYLDELPDTDYQILRCFKQGMRHLEIADLLNMSVDEVRDSLVKTYADLRMRMLDSNDGDDGGLPTRAPPPARSLDKPMKQTSLRQ